jgi:hypothetical protein
MDKWNLVRRYIVNRARLCISRSMRLHEATQFAEPPESSLYFRFRAMHVWKSWHPSIYIVASKLSAGRAQNSFLCRPPKCLNQAMLVNTPTGNQTRGRVLFDILAWSQLLKKFPFHRIQRILTVFTRNPTYLKPDKSSPSPLIPFIRPILILSAYLHNITYNIQNKYMHLERRLWALFGTPC